MELIAPSKMTTPELLPTADNIPGQDPQVEHSAIATLESLRAKRSNAGFTLVEVVLAIGIIAFAFVPLLGLLPLGLDVSRQAIDTTVQAQIAQQLTAQAQQTDFSLLSTLNTGSASTDGWFFDDQGNKCAQAKAIYKAAINVNSTTALPGLAANTKKLATVTVYVLSLTSIQGNKNTNLPANPDSKKFVVLIPDNGR